MNQHEKYFFDVNGYIVAKNILSPAQVAALNEAIDNNRDRIKLRSGDLSLSADLGESGASLNFGVSNLFTCRSANPAENDTESACGFGEEHVEMINMPSIGTNVFLGVRYRLR